MNDYKTDYGYFDKNGKEYVITRPDTPKPWVNIICPEKFGTVISQSGGGYSWLEHSKLNRITKWQQDLLKDNIGKYLFLKDKENDNIWSPTWQPVKSEYEYYRCIHGLGYTKFKYRAFGINAEVLIYIPEKDNIEICKVTIANESSKQRNLELISYVEWCLDAASSVEYRELHDLFIETKTTPNGEIKAGKRVWSVENELGQFFNRSWEYTAFHTGNPRADKYSVDRREFIGRYNSLQNPGLNGFEELPEKEKTDKWKEPIASLVWEVSLKPGEKKSFELFLGVENRQENIKDTVKKYKTNTDIYFDKTVQYWEETLDGSFVETPDSGYNYMMNYWLKYQAVSARLNGRNGYYQAGGAFGFRDQLQDSQIYFKLEPKKSRQRILEHASRQFTDGAVQHWWHPISDKGLRNDISDNLLWLPFICHRYIMETGDLGILDEKVSFVDDREKKETLRVHCEMAIQRSLSRKSKRGLPLIGEGDWNDGLSAVGWFGKGESIWLGHFLIGILRRWSSLEKRLGDKEKSENYEKNMDELIDTVNKYGWEEDRYIRATTDNGKKLGSKTSKFGKLFLNANTWAVLNGVANDEKISIIQETINKELYREYGPILFYPAYKEVDPEIGYLTRYAPGTRENGGLYFHAACWALAAECERGRNKVVGELIESFLPPNRGKEPEKYFCEPYVLPGNVDGPDSPNFGRGGFTWYTGSAAWLFTVGWDWVLGLKPVYNGIEINPCLPDKWKKVKGYRKFRRKRIEFSIENTGGKKVKVKANGKILDSNIIKYEDYKDESKIILEIKK